MKRRLPKFLAFLQPLFHWNVPPEPLTFTGHVRVVSSLEGVVYDSKNFIVDVGKTAVRNALLGVAGGAAYASIFRMAIGDGGVPVGELFNPIQPDVTWPARTGLFHEVFRRDIAAFSTPTAFAARFEGAFNSLDADVSSFSLAELVINEASLIIGDGVLVVGGDPKQINKAPPDVVDPDEVMLSTRTFKSTPFDPGTDVTITITWTITVSS